MLTYVMPTHRNNILSITPKSLCITQIKYNHELNDRLILPIFIVYPYKTEWYMLLKGNKEKIDLLEIENRMAVTRGLGEKSGGQKESLVNANMSEIL